MTTVDLNRYSTQIELIERANRSIQNQTKLLTPKVLRQHPSHVMYGGAHLFSENTFTKINELALRAFDYAATSPAYFAALAQDGWTPDFAQDLYARVRAKIEREPLEDYRIDFEDGYGIRSDAEEDTHARQAAVLLADLARKNKVPGSVGFRIKPLSTAAMRRSLRTLSIFAESFAKAFQSSDVLRNLVVTLPKVTNAAQVSALAEILQDYETRFNLGSGFFVMELLIESPEAFISADGTIPLPTFVAAAGGRCQSLHFGVFDFTSSLGIGSAGQAIDHAACDFARLWMQVTAGLAPGIGLSDGIISRLPLIPKQSDSASRLQFEDAWRYNYRQMIRSLSHGFYQGWDLHPAQLPVRHAAHFAFVMKELPGAEARLKSFSDRAATASQVAGMFDDRASVLGLLNFFERATISGITNDQELSARGVDLEKIRSAIGR